jgi:hypothetical protein
MRRLVSGQLVRLDLDDEESGLDCQVRHVAGPVALLDRLEEIPAPLEAMLPAGSFCMMLFTHHGGMVALRGVATGASEDLTQLAFVVADGVQVKERRVAERVAMVARAHVRPLDGDGAGGPGIETYTANISLGGVLVNRSPKLVPAHRHSIELFLPGESEPICAEAQLARETPVGLGLMFTAVDDEHHLRLARLIVAHQLHPPGAH